MASQHELLDTLAKGGFTGGRGKWYTFRSTLDKLSDHLNSIEDDGDQVVKVQHVGGRDWVILCRKSTRGIPPKTDLR